MDKHEEIARDVVSRVGHIAVYDKRVQVVKAAIRAAVAEAVEAEREACARTAEAQWSRHMPEDADYEWGYVDARKDIAGAIRNRARAAASAGDKGDG